MADEMVMRSVYLRPRDDAELRQLAFREEVSKSDLIRSAIRAKLDEWWSDPEALRRDLGLGRRERQVGPESALPALIDLQGIKTRIGVAHPENKAEYIKVPETALTAPVLETE